MRQSHRLRLPRPPTTTELWTTPDDCKPVESKPAWPSVWDGRGVGHGPRRRTGRATATCERPPDTVCNDVYARCASSHPGVASRRRPRHAGSGVDMCTDVAGCGRRPNERHGLGYGGYARRDIVWHGHDRHDHGWDGRELPDGNGRRQANHDAGVPVRLPGRDFQFLLRVYRVERQVRDGAPAEGASRHLPRSATPRSFHQSPSKWLVDWCAHTTVGSCIGRVENLTGRSERCL